MRLLLKTALIPDGEGLDVALAFLRAGVDVRLQPTQVEVPLPASVAQLLTYPVKGFFDVTLHWLNPDELGVNDISANTITVAYASGLPPSTGQLAGYDLVVADDSTIADLLSGFTKAVAVVQAGFWPEDWPGRSRAWNAPVLNFCAIDDEPSLIIDAFRQLRAEHPDLAATLNVKSRTPVTDDVPGLKIYTDDWPPETLRDFYYSQHVFIAVSQSSAHVLPFLSSGGTAIAVNCGGHRQWLSSQIAYPLREPDIGQPFLVDELKTMMLYACQHRPELARKAGIAADLIPAMCAWPKVIDRIMDRIGELDERGERAAHNYRVAKAHAEESRQVTL